LVIYKLKLNVIRYSLAIKRLDKLNSKN